MTHYVCPECGGEASHRKVCETEGCKKEGKSLAECQCVDGKHKEVTG